MTAPRTIRLVYSVTESAELLGISRSTAYELVARGELATVRIGRRRMVRYCGYGVRKPKVKGLKKLPQNRAQKLPPYSVTQKGIPHGERVTIKLWDTHVDSDTIAPKADDVVHDPHFNGFKERVVREKLRKRPVITKETGRGPQNHFC